MMKTKKVLALLLSFCCIFATACDKESHQCDFTEKIIEESYLKSSATCQDRAKYYYSCTCGEHGEEYFETGNVGTHNYTVEIADPAHVKTSATCKKPATYFKECEYCGKMDNSQTFTGEDLANCEYTKEVASEEYLKEEPTTTTSAVYYKSCKWCGGKGETTFVYGNPLRDDYTEEEKALYRPNSLTVTLYDVDNSVYGFTYNTQVQPLRPVIQIQKGTTASGSWQEYHASVEKVSSYNTSEQRIEFYVVKAEIPLEVGQTYVYRAYDKYVNVGTVITTITAKNPEVTNFSFAHVSDSQGSPSDFGKVLQNVVGNVDFLLHTGDIVNSSRYEYEWTDMLNGNFAKLSQIPMMAISGNHETTQGDSGSNEQYKHFHNKMPTQDSTSLGYFYSFVYGNAKFIMLNTNDLSSGQLKPQQYNWLVNELQNNDCTWTIVAMHNPMYSVGKYGIDPARNYVSLQLRAQLQGLFAQYGVDVVLQGHDHVISRTYPINGQGQPQTETWQTIGGVSYTVDPSGVIYVMNGPAGNQSRGPSGEAPTLYHYAHSSHKSSWAEFIISGNQMRVIVKHASGSSVQTYHDWGIKKSA